MASAGVGLCLLLVLLMGCGGGMDDRPQAPRPRIVSLTPALTETLFAMGLGDHVVGVTRFCHLPPGQERARIEGDAAGFHAEPVLALRPDLVVTQSDPAALRGVTDVDRTVRVEQFHIERLADVGAAMRRLGELTDRPDVGEAAAGQFEAKLSAVRDSVAGRGRPRVLFVMGTDRPVAAGPATFLGDLIELAGGTNAAADLPGGSADERGLAPARRWLNTQLEQILVVQPDVIVCQVLELGRQEEARAYWTRWRQMPAGRDGRVHVVTDPGWTIPSPGLADLAAELAGWIHGEASP